MEIQDKTKDELITELNELLKKTNYLKVQNETLTAELVANEKIVSKKRARLSVNHSQQGFSK
jgi:ribosomal protein L29